MNKYIRCHGGSWDDLQGDARCASRLRFRPVIFLDDLGFRLVLKSK